MCIFPGKPRRRGDMQITRNGLSPLIGNLSGSIETAQSVESP